MSRILRASLACALVSIVAAPALAQSHRLAAAWDAAIGEEGGYLSPAAHAQLNIVAYHAAVAKLCEGFEIDTAKIAAASDAVVAEAVKGLEGEALIARHADVLIDIGTSHGIFLAEGSLQPDKFCDEAAEVRADAAFTDLWK